MKIIIAGGRDFDDYKQLCSICNDILPQFENVSLISGGQVTTDYATGEKWGADYLGEQYAKEHDYKVERFPADWDKYGKRAGYLRNLEMAKYADGLIAFHDHNSKGTKNMISLANQHELMIVVAYY